MGELQGIVRFTFHPGKVEDFKRLSAECLAVVRAEDDGNVYLLFNLLFIHCHRLCCPLSSSCLRWSRWLS